MNHKEARTIIEDELRNLVDTVIQATPHMYQCNRGPRPSGAVLLANDGRTIRGEVGPVKGSPNCLKAGCMIEWSSPNVEEMRIESVGNIYVAHEDLSPHCVRNVHAEVEALLLAARWGVPTMNATMISINKPCYHCSMACVKAGVKLIAYGWAAYDEERTNTMLENAGVEAVQIEMEEPEWPEL